MDNQSTVGKKHIVTGGAGFIGSHIAKRLLEDGHDVWVVDNLSTGKIENLPDGVVFLDLDIAKEESYRQFPKGIDAVFHLAAQSSGEISETDPVTDLEANVVGTVRLLDWCAGSGVKRFLFAGSMGVYGSDAKIPVREDNPCRPASFYGVSKLADEHYIKSYQRKGLETTIFRIFNAYGPGQNIDNLKQGMVSIYLAYLLKGKPVLVKGSQDRFRDFIYIEDLVDAWMQALDSPVTFGKTYNLASGKKTLVSDLLLELITVWGADPATYPIHQGENTPGDVFGIYADIDLITSEIEWAPKTNIRSGVEHMVKWARSLSLNNATARGERI